MIDVIFKSCMFGYSFGRKKIKTCVLWMQVVLVIHLIVILIPTTIIKLV